MCDAGHHRVVAIDLTDHTEAETERGVRNLREVAGTGKNGFFPVGASGHALELALGSPWAITRWNDLFVVALAGAHQLVVWDPAAERVAHLAGTGIENLVDGGVHECALAQPSGVCVGGDGFLYFVDAESSSLRRLNTAKNRVETLLGDGLFSFGKEDGPLEQAQFQHCADLAWSTVNAGVWVCDSYNNALRFVSPSLGQVATLALPFPLSEPNGVFLGDGLLHVVDTNAHRVLSFPEPLFPWAEPMPVPLEAVKTRAGPFRVLADFVLRPRGPLPA